MTFSNQKGYTNMENRTAPHPTQHYLIRVREVCQRTGLSKSSIYDLMSQGSFPHTVRLGGRSVAFVESGIDEWIAERIAARNVAV